MFSITVWMEYTVSCYRQPKPVNGSKWWKQEEYCVGFPGTISSQLLLRLLRNHCRTLAVSPEWDMWTLQTSVAASIWRAHFLANCERLTPSVPLSGVDREAISGQAIYSTRPYVRTILLDLARCSDDCRWRWPLMIWTNSEWVSSFLTAHQHNIGYAVLYY